MPVKENRLIVNLSFELNNISESDLLKIQNNLQLQFRKEIDNNCFIEDFALDKRPLFIKSIETKTVGHEQLYIIDIAG
ncbi:hypothetical protein [Flavobacterium gelatinilyticum]|uniref:hypothetical protein n=1 Tax=Flavobacterium gelatinilyticum TaxID=3003260 RepID=UPI00247FE18B|nr:hypothetical protein [Flavobacterium gelatinilyticum]